eukprot:4787549-Amphidinium_carterae.2
MGVSRAHARDIRVGIGERAFRVTVFASVILGLADNAYKSIHDTPYGGRTWAALSEEVVAESASAETDRGKRITVKQSKEMRSKFRSTIHMAAFFLADRHCRSLAVMIGDLERPLLEACKRHAEACTSPWGSRVWYIKQCIGDVTHVKEMAQMLCNRLALSGWGFQLGWGALQLPADVMRDNDAKAAAAVLIMRKVAALELVSTSMFMWRPPYCFAGLLSDDADVRHTCTERLKLIYAALEVLETSSSTGSWTRRFLNDLHWPRSTIIREIFIGLAESKWSTPGDIKTMLTCIFSGHGCSKIVEEAFRVVVQHTPASGKMNRMSRVATLMSSSLLAEYAQKEVQPLQSAGTETQVSEADMKDKETWSVPAYNLTGVATAFLVDSIDSLEGMENHWLNVVMPEATVIWNEEVRPEQGWFVLGTCTWCVFAVPVKPKKRSEEYWFDLILGEQFYPRMLHIKSLEHWKVCNVIARVPVESASTSGVSFKLNGAKTGLLIAAARDGFSKMTDDRLPATVGDKLVALIRHVLPKVSEEEVTEILAKRGVKSTARISVCLPEMEAMLVEGASAEEVEEIRKAVDDEHQERAKRAAAKPKAKAKAKARAPKPLGLSTAGFHTETLKRFLPEVPGCAITEEKHWHTRLKATYPVQSPPYSKSCSFVHSAGKVEAAKVVLAWVWKHHTDAIGAVCPWQLE